MNVNTHVIWGQYLILNHSHEVNPIIIQTLLPSIKYLHYLLSANYYSFYYIRRLLQLTKGCTIVLFSIIIIKFCIIKSSIVSENTRIKYINIL